MLRVKTLPADSRGRALGYETWQDWDYKLDVITRLVPTDLAPYYRAVKIWFASTPRYAFVCPCCEFVFPSGASAESDVRIHIKGWQSKGICAYKQAKPVVVQKFQPKGL